MHSVIGTKVRDIITGFTGTVTGRVEYLTGCNQLPVAPSVKDDGSLGESQWLDEQRCQAVEGERIVLDNGASPGFDRVPPKR